LSDIYNELFISDQPQDCFQLEDGLQLEDSFQLDDSFQLEEGFQLDAAAEADMEAWATENLQPDHQTQEPTADPSRTVCFGMVCPLFL
jgi:hypothetical protein